MSELTVSRLKLRATDGAHWGARLRLERALETIHVPDSKVYAVRKLAGIRTRRPVGHTNSAQQLGELSEAVESKLALILAGAIHGAQTDAANSNAVWFKDLVEARAHFLALIASGQRPQAWFWKSILGHEWVQSPPEETVAGQFAAIRSGTADAPALAAAFLRAIALAGLEPVALMIANAALSPSPDGSDTLLDASVVPAANNLPGNSQTMQKSILGKWAPVALLVAANPELRTLAKRIVAHGEKLEPLSIAVHLLLVRHRPSLIAEPASAQALTSAVTQHMATIARPENTRQIGASHADKNPLSNADNRQPASVRKDEFSGAAEAAETTATLAEGTPSAAEDQSHDTGPDQIMVTDPIGDPRTVQGAGLLLVIPSLIRLGMPEWLENNPDWKHADFARLFLFKLALRYAPEGMKEMAHLLGQDGAVMHGPPTPAWDAAQTAWRVGLDRFLRRTAQIRLHDLAADSATLSLENDIWRCRFPIGAIRMGLRRNALDRDPGWAPWLGLSIRYDFIAGPGERGGLG